MTPEHPDDHKETAEEEAERSRLYIVQQVQAQAEILKRHYETSQNPIFVWATIRIFAGWHRTNSASASKLGHELSRAGGDSDC